ncbi:MAG: SMP-30/gluconolactonase/LRE family protein, partial [Gemmatimonadetes bacterium]|nr:SMP-30/gluconolactonase/LRE family protein [Gemmatimonadota bacterium]
MPHCTPELLVDGLGFPEGPRWRAGRLFFSDMVIRQVMSVDLQGDRQTVVALSDIPSGIGWLPGGEMLVVSETEMKVLRLTPEGLSTYADTGVVAPEIINDMVVDRQGRAYVGGWGGGVDESKPIGGANFPDRSHLFLIEPGGAVRVVADAMISPNGMAITPDGSTLIVAETFACRLTAF